MSKFSIDKAYVSPHDRFLFGFDLSHDKSISKLKEIKKHQRIALLRDHPQLKEEKRKIWDKF